MSPSQPRQVLVLPPIRRGSGAAEAVWGALLVHQVRREVRIILPQDGGETRRLCGLVQAVRAPEVLRIAAGEALPELIRAADVIVLTALDPIGSYPEAVIAAGIAPDRLVLSDLPALRGAVGDAASHIHWCAHPTPREIARQILRVLESPVTSAGSA